MEDKIEVNEYVRTNNNYIRKVIAERLNGYLVDVSYYNEIIDDTTLGIIKKEDIKKHSKQLINLIEDKDIVEIELSEEFVEKKDKKKLIQIGDIYTKETLQKDIDNGIITRILTILSYNQYMDNCYKVGGEE